MLGLRHTILNTVLLVDRLISNSHGLSHVSLTLILISDLALSIFFTFHACNVNGEGRPVLFYMA
jgi:hypothetical protein